MSVVKVLKMLFQNFYDLWVLVVMSLAYVSFLLFGVSEWVCSIVSVTSALYFFPIRFYFYSKKERGHKSRYVYLWTAIVFGISALLLWLPQTRIIRFILLFLVIVVAILSIKNYKNIICLVQEGMESKAVIPSLLLMSCVFSIYLVTSSEVFRNIF